MMVTMIDNPFQLHRHSHRRRLGIVNSNIDSDKIRLLDRERPESPLETTRTKRFCETNAKPVKIVHFVRQATYYECPVSMSKEDITRVWYNEEDYESFKRSALRAARDIRRNNSHLVSGIDHALEQSKRCATEIQDQIELEHLLQSLSPPSRKLQDWCMDESLRGLERLSSRALNEHVYNNQMFRSKLKLFRKSVNDEGIRVIQEQDSRCSCILARWMALSDTVAATAAFNDTSSTLDDLDLSWASL